MAVATTNAADRRGAAAEASSIDSLIQRQPEAQASASLFRVRSPSANEQPASTPTLTTSRHLPPRDFPDTSQARRVRSRRFLCHSNLIRQAYLNEPPHPATKLPLTFADSPTSISRPHLELPASHAQSRPPPVHERRKNAFTDPARGQAIINLAAR